MASSLGLGPWKRGGGGFGGWNRCGAHKGRKRGSSYNSNEATWWSSIRLRPEKKKTSRLHLEKKVAEPRNVLFRGTQISTHTRARAQEKKGKRKKMGNSQVLQGGCNVLESFREAGGERVIRACKKSFTMYPGRKNGGEKGEQETI